jgi:hypothetical protein
MQHIICLLLDLLPDIIPQVTECMHDTKQEVSTKAHACMIALCKVVGNPDIEVRRLFFHELFQAYPSHYLLVNLAASNLED